MPDSPIEIALYLKIGKAFYRLDRSGDAAEHQGWTLTQDPNLVYTVHRDNFGTHCTCADFVYRKGKTGEPCKHIRALMEVRLL